MFSRLSFDNNQIDSRTNVNNLLNFDIYHVNLKNSFNDSNTYIYHKAIAILSNEFRQKILIDYVKKKIWTDFVAILIDLIDKIIIEQKISVVVVVELEISVAIEQIFANSTNETSKKMKIDIDFKLISNDLMYYIDDKIRRLYIFVVVEKKIFV